MLESKFPVADVTGVRTFSGVGSNMSPEIFSGPKFSRTKETNDLPVGVVGELATYMVVQFFSGLWVLLGVLLLIGFKCSL